MADRNARLRAIANQLEVLAEQVRLLAIDEEPRGGQAPPGAPPVPEPAPGRAPPMREIKVGSRVLLIRPNDALRGHTGTVTGKRGVFFWDLRLDPHGYDTRGGQLIYRRGGSLQLLPVGT